MSTSQKLNLRAEFARATSSYFGSNFDYLSPSGKLMTAIAWDNYPDKSYDTLVETIQKFSPDIAESFSGRGINFQILSKGDSHKASGFKITGYITCDTEEWYEDIPASERIWQEDEELNEQVQNAIAQFEFNVCKEVEGYLKKKFGVTPSKLTERLSVQVKTTWGMCKGNAWCGADGETISTFTTLEDAQNYIRQVIEMEHKGNNSFDQDSVKKADKEAYNLQIGQSVTVSETPSDKYFVYEYKIEEVNE